MQVFVLAYWQSLCWLKTNWNWKLCGPTPWKSTKTFKCLLPTACMSCGLHPVSPTDILNSEPPSSRFIMPCSSFVSNSILIAHCPYIRDNITVLICTSKDLLIKDSVSTWVPYWALSFKLKCNTQALSNPMDNFLDKLHRKGG